MKKACKKCKFITNEEKCPNCGSTEFSDNMKVKIFMLKPAESEIAKHLKINKDGVYAVSTK